MESNERIDISTIKSIHSEIINIIIDPELSKPEYHELLIMLKNTLNKL